MPGVTFARFCPDQHRGLDPTCEGSVTPSRILLRARNDISRVDQRCCRNGVLDITHSRANGFRVCGSLTREVERDVTTPTDSNRRIVATRFRKRVNKRAGLGAGWEPEPQDEIVFTHRWIQVGGVRPAQAARIRNSLALATGRTCRACRCSSTNP